MRHPQLNAGEGHEQYFVGMDVELDDFMARHSLSRLAAYDSHTDDARNLLPAAGLHQGAGGHEA